MNEWEECFKLQGSLPGRLPLLEKLVIKSYEQLLVTIHCLPALGELQIDGCKRVEFSRPINLGSLNSVSSSDISNQVKIQYLQDIRSLNRLQISRCPQLISLVTEEEHDQQQPESPCRLQLLELKYCEGLLKIPQALLTLSSLSEMRIRSCASLVSVPQAALPSQLRTVEIKECNALESLPEKWIRSLDSSLQSLKISSCDSLISFPDVALPSQLRTVEIEECNALESLPEAWLRNSDSSLQSLEIRNCNSLVSFPEVSLPSQLKTITIGECCALKSLPEAWMQNSSTSLQSLKIKGCNSLKFIARIQLPPSLKWLIISYCCNLRTLTGEQDIRSSSSGSTTLTSFSSENELPATLKHLDVSFCSNLAFLSRNGNLPQALKYLCVSGCSELELLAERLGNTSVEEISISSLKNLKSLPASLHNLHHLQKIFIGACPNLELFPQGGLPSTKLTELRIWRCDKLKALPNCMQNLTSVLHLQIRKCLSLVSFPEDGFPTNLQSLEVDDLKISKPLFEWGLNRFTSLRELIISGGCPDLELSPRFPAFLTELRISDMPNLKSLSSIGEDLTSLEILDLNECSKLKYFSKQGLPKSLLQLIMVDCPLIAKRCRKDKGKYWSMITHIPRVEINNRSVF